MNEGLERVCDLILCICMIPVGAVLAVLFVLSIIARAIGEFINEIYDNDMYWDGKD